MMYHFIFFIPDFFYYFLEISQSPPHAIIAEQRKLALIMGGVICFEE